MKKKTKILAASIGGVVVIGLTAFGFSQNNLLRGTFGVTTPPVINTDYIAEVDLDVRDVNVDAIGDYYIVFRLNNIGGEVIPGYTDGEVTITADGAVVSSQLWTSFDGYLNFYNPGMSVDQDSASFPNTVSEVEICAISSTLLESSLDDNCATIRFDAPAAS